MPTTISSGRWKLDYTNRILYRDTAVTPTVVDEVLDLHKDVLDLFDVSTQMDDPSVMSAQTPFNFTIGDPEGFFADKPWFISPLSCKYLKGGAIQSNSWTRTEGSENGIVVVPYSGVTDPVASDIGKTITHETDLDTGVLLGFDTTRGELYIRPATNAIGNSFNSTSGNLDVTGGTQNVGAQTAAATTGEFKWANPYSLAPSLQTGTRIYVAQNATKLTDWPASIGLNADGQMDILLLVQVGGAVIDDGEATFFARRGGTITAHNVVDLSEATRTPVGLAPQDNSLNDGLGHHTLNFNNGGGTGTFQVGDIFYDSGDTETAGVIAATTDSGAATGSIDYFLIRGLSQFSSLDNITNGSRTAQVNGAPTNLQPVTDAATISPIAFGSRSKDINNGAGAKPYSIEVDPNSLSFVRVYRALQYMLRRGSTESLDGVNGELYTGLTLHLNYSGQTGGEFVEGNVVWGQTSGAQGVVVSDHVNGAEGDLILRNVRGTFVDTEVVGDAESAPTVTADIDTVRSIPTLNTAVFGTIAGGTYYGAPGMFFTLANIASGEEKLYSLVDDNGDVQNPPNTVPVEGTGLAIGDWLSIFRLTAALSSGGTIVKDEYTGHALNNNQDGTTYEVTTSITQDVPPAGVLAVVKATDDEQHYWYASWTGSVFTLVAIPNGTVSAGGGDTTGITLTDTVAGDFVNDGVKPGMLVRNSTDGSYGIVKSVDSATQLTLETQNNGQGLIGGTENDWDDGDAYRINKLLEDLDSKDTYIPFLHVKHTSGDGDESTTIIQSVAIPVMFRVRQGRVIQPFIVGGSIGATGFTQAAIRNLDTIAT